MGSAENRKLEDRLRQMKKFLKKHENEVRQFGCSFEHYYMLHYNDETSQFQFAEEKIGVIDDEIMKAIANSSRSYEENLEFITAAEEAV